MKTRMELRKDDEDSLWSLFYFAGSPPPPPPPQFDDEEEGIPIPEEDPYAATGPDIFGTNLVPEHYIEKGEELYLYFNPLQAISSFIDPKSDKF